MTNLSSFSVLILTRTKRHKKIQKEGLYARVTVDGKRTEFSLSYEVPKGVFDVKSQKCFSNSAEAKRINDFVTIVKGELNEIRRKLILQEKEVTAELVKSVYKGQPDPNQEKNPTLLELYELHNQKFQELIGTKGHSASTLKRHKTSLSHVKEFLENVYSLSDICFEGVNYKFLNDYEHYLKSVRKCNHNSTMKYIKNAGKIINEAYAEGYLEHNPFFKFKMHYEPVERKVLSEKEIEKMISIAISEKRLDKVRDMFVFCIHTGIAYGDVEELRMEHFYIDKEGTKWVKNRRLKTNTEFLVPILPIVDEIIDKYADHPQRIKEGRVIPEISNQNYNGYLKEVAIRCKIKKNLTSHIARHTFATTIALNNGVPIEIVSKMLGHSSVRTTQIYAKVQEQAIKNGMSNLLNSDKPKKKKKNNKKGKKGGKSND